MCVYARYSTCRHHGNIIGPYYFTEQNGPKHLTISWNEMHTHTVSDCMLNPFVLCGHRSWICCSGRVYPTEWKVSSRSWRVGIQHGTHIISCLNILKLS